MKTLLLAATLITLTCLSCSKEDDPEPDKPNMPNCTDPGPDTSIYEGTWSGTFSGGSTGTWSWNVCANGTLSGLATLTNGIIRTHNGTVSESGLVNVMISNGGTETGQFNAEDSTYFGTWQNNNVNFPLSGTSIGTKE